MKEFTSLIRVRLVGSSTPATFEFMADHFDYEPSVTDDEGGVSWNCDKTFVIDKPSDDATRLFSVPRSAILTLMASDRTSFEIGTDEVPARVQVAGHLQKAQLIVSCTMLSNPLS